MMAVAPVEAGQIAALVSPGPLARAHAAVDGMANCSRCHETGRKVTTAKCLACHQPIADRIARRSGVHRNADAGCVNCHTEHAGESADLRRLNPATFDHAKDTRFALDGVHAKIAGTCAACHKGRSFLDAGTACASCHTDVHKGSLGSRCETCHSTREGFKAARTSFNHATTRFPLTGRHAEVGCASCHKNGVFRGLGFESCTSCHTDPHARAFGTTCTTCHTTAGWATKNVDHTRTRFPLIGAHAKVECASCHTGKSMTAPLKFDTCASCHVNVHRESIRQDCRACHSESTFTGAPFDHAARTRFALDGKHAGLACAKCHPSVSPPGVPLAKRVADYRGASSECATCHGPKDPHKGEFGRVCDSCHGTASFDTRAFVHAGAPAFYGGSHSTVACDKCHVPSRTPLGTGPPRPVAACASCHKDAHLGQVGAACEACHTVDGAHFTAPQFSHARASFALTGKHETTDCAKCHKTETRAFPAGQGTAMLLKPLEAGCRSCHADVHLGQVDTRCETCHQTRSFKLLVFEHRGLQDFFAGFHGKYPCAACHKKETGTFPAGSGTAIRFRVGTTCIACHAK